MAAMVQAVGTSAPQESIPRDLTDLTALQEVLLSVLRNDHDIDTKINRNLYDIYMRVDNERVKAARIRREVFKLVEDTSVLIRRKMETLKPGVLEHVHPLVPIVGGRYYWDLNDIALWSARDLQVFECTKKPSIKTPVKSLVCYSMEEMLKGIVIANAELNEACLFPDTSTRKKCSSQHALVARRLMDLSNEMRSRTHYWWNAIRK
ncbi:hypothetical protein BGX31_007708 [Mortierella sp. GBA43]|nr:hypothetical protein BGX31_007708 [Mortierella sp. GBA43]